ncbi:MAG: tetratricopeptide repeat-containing sensor histidine kinase [Bacteroidetes bacterium]|nr:tetratricopeptide repeat-containing sensor histidine kinase [Bacteroidota bacterium]
MKELMKLLFIMLILTPVPAAAQEKYRIDSLITALEREEVDSIRCRKMLEIAEACKTSDTTISMSYLRMIKSFGAELRNKSYMGRCYELEGEMKAHFGLYDEAIFAYDRAMAFYNEADNDIAFYETMKDKGNVYLFQGSYPQAMNYYETALDYYRRINYKEGVSRCLNNMGIIYKNQGKYVDALRVYNESISIIDPEKDPMQIAKGYINMGNVFVYLGIYEQALEHFEKAREIAEKEGGVQSRALCLINSGVVLNKLNSFQKAEEYYQRALELGTSIDDPKMISNCLINIGTNLSSMGNHELGLEYVERGQEIKVKLGDLKAISNCLIHKAEIYSKMNEYDQASKLFMEAIPVKEELGDVEALTRCYLGLATISYAHNDFSSASQQSELALETAREINSLEHLTTGYGIKRDIALARNDYRSAYNYESIQNAYHDSLMDEATSKAAMEMEYRYRSRALEKENNNLKIQSELTIQLMKKKNALMKSIAGFTILLATLLILGAYFLRRMRLSSMKLEEKNLVITRQNMELDNMNSTKDRMMSIIAHDLRGTMGNQITAIDVLHRVEASGNKDFDRKKLMGNLKNSASYSLELLENLLHWSRLEENASHFHPQEIDLSIIVAGCMSLFDETAMIKKISVEKKMEDGVQLKGDRIMLEAIIRNLLSNALKFTNHGGSIIISAKKEKNMILVEVADTGVGMTKEQIDKVMYNGGYTSRGTANEKGAGIGMTLVREFTAIHKGSLDIKSEPGAGTRVNISFPTES